jgi:hypothetical protein
VTTVHAEDEATLGREDPHEPLVARRKRDRNGDDRTGGFRQDAHEPDDIRARGLGLERVLLLQAEEVAALAERDFRFERQLPEQLGTELRPGLRTTNVPAAPTFTTS